MLMEISLELGSSNAVANHNFISVCLQHVILGLDLQKAGTFMLAPTRGITA